MTRIPVAVQLWSVHNECKRDMAAVLRAVAEMGYDGVEFAGYYDHTAEELRAMLDDLGLRAAGTHIGRGTLTGEALPATIEFNRTLGNRWLVIPGLPREDTADRDSLLATAAFFNEVAERLAPHDMLIGSHQHGGEMDALPDGEIRWDAFCAATGPGVIVQPDTGNALVEGAHVAPFIERHPDRIPTVHLKEHSATKEEVLIGEGDVHWDDVFRACRAAGTEWYIVEQETYPYPPLESVDRSLRNLRNMGL